MPADESEYETVNYLHGNAETPHNTSGALGHDECQLSDDIDI